MRIALALAIAALALSACGADDEGAGGDERADRRDAALKFARCMRENGVDMPDPQADEAGRVRFRAQAGSNEKRVAPAAMRRAEEKCRKYLAELKPRNVSPEQQKERREQALKFARCMREHGVDFPDPQFGDGGQTSIRIGPGRGGIDPRSPRFQRAEKACRSESPFERREEVAP